MALIGTAATLKARVPFIHFCDGWRTSHEVQKIQLLDDDALRAMIDEDLVLAVRERAMTPTAPPCGAPVRTPTFTSRAGRPSIATIWPSRDSAEYMDRFADLTGRKYHLFDYAGAPDADRVLVLMGSGAETAEETVDHLRTQGEKVGVLRVRLYRPFSIEHFVKALPKSVKSLAVLDRTKEPGSAGEPLYLDVIDALSESGVKLKVIGGRYGLASKRVHAGDGQAVFDELAKPERRTTSPVGIKR